MNRRAVFPMIIDVVAHVLDELRDEMRSDGFMLAAFDGNAAWAVVPGV